MKSLLKILGSIIIIFYGSLIFCSKSFDLEIKYQHIEANELSISFEEAIKKITLLYSKGKELDDISECLSIVKYCDLYLDEAISLLNKNTLSEKEVFTLIKMMQFLSYNNYIKFFEVCTKLYLEDRIYLYQIAYIINVNFYFNNKIAKSFYKPKVIKCLLQIKKKAKSAEANREINGILSGYIWAYILFAHSFNKIFP